MKNRAWKHATATIQQLLFPCKDVALTNFTAYPKKPITRKLEAVQSDQEKPWPGHAKQSFRDATVTFFSDGYGSRRSVIKKKKKKMTNKCYPYNV